MQSEFSPPLTRFDAVLWFLRVQLWLSVLALLSSFVQPYQFLSLASSLQSVAAFGIPILVLLLFPKIFAGSAVGYSATEPVASIFDLRPLVLRCVGLSLFVSNLGGAVIYSLYILYSFVPNVSSVWLYGSPTQATFVRFQIAGTTLRFLLGFFLAFGPAIRDNFRVR